MLWNVHWMHKQQICTFEFFFIAICFWVQHELHNIVVFNLIRVIIFCFVFIQNVDSILLVRLTVSAECIGLPGSSIHLILMAERMNEVDIFWCVLALAVLRKVSFIVFIPGISLVIFNLLANESEWAWRVTEEEAAGKNFTTWYLELSVLCQTLKRSLHSFTLSLVFRAYRVLLLLLFFFYISLCYEYEYFLMKSTYENVAYASAIKINSHHHKKQTHTHAELVVKSFYSLSFWETLSLAFSRNFHL